MIIFPKLKAGNINLQEIGFLYYICKHLKSGIFDQSLPEIAAATNFSIPTIHRLLGRLIANGFIKIVRPSVKTKTGNTPVGYQPIQLMEWEQVIDTKDDPIPNGMIPIVNRFPVLYVDSTNHNNLGIGADGMGTVYGVPIDPYQVVRRVLMSIEHRREMAELAASHWWLPDTQQTPWKIIKSAEVISVGLGHEYDHWYEIDDHLSTCGCGSEPVAYSANPLGDNRYQIFLKQKCESCLSTARAVERAAEMEATEKEFDRLLKKGWVKFIHDGDRVKDSDYAVVDGVRLLKPICELALDRCECGNPVFYELVKSDSGVHVNAGQQCGTCWQLQPTAGVESPVLNPPTGSQAGYAE